MGNGEMAQLTRDFDWANSPLGPVEQWPVSLRTAVGIVLNSRFPMLMWWGNDLIQFYNDAYRPCNTSAKYRMPPIACTP
jgi:hypothetical protein